MNLIAKKVQDVRQEEQRRMVRAYRHGLKGRAQAAKRDKPKRLRMRAKAKPFSAW